LLLFGLQVGLVCEVISVLFHGLGAGVTADVVTGTGITGHLVPVVETFMLGCDPEQNE
jgi:hypothetical protein